MQSPHRHISSEALLDKEISQWIIGKINVLEGRAKSCAFNAIRFLNWANDTRAASSILSVFSAMHATEEAVTAFISAAKANGHKSHAKGVNLHDHHNKALVSVFARRCSLIAEEGSLAISLHPKSDGLAYRVPNGDEYQFGSLHLSSFNIHSDTEDDSDRGISLGDVPSFDEIVEEAKEISTARNTILYATDKGYPTGFTNPDYEIARNSAISLGLIWGP